MLKKLFGPSTLIAAAFIGPGTITTCTIAGVQTSYELIWALVFSIFATIVLQEMAARLGFVTRNGLGEAINNQFPKGFSRILVLFIVIGAIIIGNAAYEAGNLSGGVLGADLIIGEYKFWPIVLGGIAFCFLYFGKYKLIEKFLIALVLLMSISFLITAFMVQPNLTAILKGLWPSNFNNESYKLILGLIGTTVVPYNLFLHASTIPKKWSSDASLKDVRIENTFSILLGGLISILIVITAAASNEQIQEVSNAKDLAIQLQPVFGNYAKVLMGLGLLAAGLSSAITAPLAAGFAAQGIFGWPKNQDHKYFRLTWIIILIFGVFVSMTGFKPVKIIQFAQITNAILLPFIAIYLMYISNSKKLLHNFTNSIVSNVLGGIVIIITLIISFKSFNSIFNWL